MRQCVRWRMKKSEELIFYNLVVVVPWLRQGLVKENFSLIIVPCLFGLGHGCPALHGLMEPSNIQPGGQELGTKKDGDGQV